VSCSLDLNLLLYASDRSSARHEAPKRFLEARAAGPELLYLAWPTLMAYVRLATHSRIFAAPLSPHEAVGNLQALLALPHVRAVSELDGFADAYERMTGGLVVRGNLVPDAHLATILFQHGVRTLYSSDRDFRTFSWLDVRDPFVSGDHRNHRADPPKFRIATTPAPATGIRTGSMGTDDCHASLARLRR